MQEKAYYRLNELQHHHGITADEIRFLVEQKRLRLSFLLQDISLIVGKLVKQGFIGQGSTTVDAIASVDISQSLALLSRGKVKTKTVYLRQASFKYYSPAYPFKTKAPNSEIIEWHPTELSTIKQGVVVAKNFPREQQSSAAAMTDIFKMFSGDATPPDYLKEKIKKNGDTDIYCEEFKFSLSDACLFVDDLKRHGLLGSDTASKPYSSKLKEQNGSADGKPNRSTTEPNRQARATYYNRGSKAKRIVSNLIDHSPTATASELWALLHESQSDDALLDLIDPESVVLEVTTDKILWNVSEELPERQRQITRGTFNNLVTELKK